MLILLKQKVFCVCVWKNSDLIKRSGSSFHKGTPCVVILREGPCGSRAPNKVMRVSQRGCFLISPGRWGVGGRGKRAAAGGRGGWVVLWLEASGGAGPRTDWGALYSPVTGARTEMSESGSKVSAASFKARIKAGGDRGVTGIHFSRCFCMYESFSCFPPVLKHNTSPQEFHCFYKAQQ